MKFNLNSPASPNSVSQGAVALTAALVAQTLPITLSAADASTGANVRLPEVETSEERRNPFVSSPKFTAPLQDTPQTVVVIPSAVYLQQGATTLSDALRNTPGITFAAGEGGAAAATSGDAFYMRGFDTAGSLYVDGVRDVGAVSRDVFNLEQVEVAKGAAGADVGRGASAGYINVETKVAGDTNFTQFSAAYGIDSETSGTRQRLTLDTNHALPGSPLPGTAVRLNALWQDSDAVGREVAKNHTWGFAPSVTLGLGTPTRLSLSTQHTYQDNVPDYGLPGSQFPGFVATPAPIKVERDTFYGFTSDYDRVTSHAFNARMDHDLNADVRVSNRFRISSNERDAVVTTPGTSPTSYVASTGLLTRSRQGNKRDTSILSNITGLTGRFQTGRVRHDVSTGVEFSSEKAYSPAFTSATLTPIPLDGSDPSATPSGTPVRSGAYTDVKIDTAAVYLFDTLTFGTKFQVNGGVRAERYGVDFLSVAAGGAASRVDADNDLVTWKGGLVYKPAPAGTLYVAYSVSEKPPGTDFTLSTAAGNQNNPDTAPQVTDTTEVGVKWSFFNNRLATSAAAFETVNDKTVFTDPILGPVPAGKQTVRGVEFNASGSITERWVVFAGFAYLDSEINSGTAAQVGTSLPLIPRVSGNLWTTYLLPYKFMVGGGIQYSGQANRLQTSQAAPVAMPSYTVVNLLGRYEISETMNVTLNVNNALDREYVQSYNNNGGRFMPGAPRSFLLTANVRF